MKKTNAWWLTGLVLVAVLIVVGLLVFGDDDDDADPAAATDPTPTAAASQPVTAPETTGTPVPGTPAPSTKTVPTKKPTTNKPATAPSPSKPVSLRATAPIDAGATAQITAIKSVTSKAVGPGEISGPALQVTMRISAGTKSVDLDDVVVNGYYGKDSAPAIPVARPGGKPFTGVLKGGDDATAVYVFNVPEKARQKVTIELFFAAGQPPVLFSGSAS